MDERIRCALTLYLFGVLGVFLAAAPWTALWDRGTLFLLPTPLGSLARSGWTRGVASGVGILDLVVAAREGAILWRLVKASARGHGP